MLDFAIEWIAFFLYYASPALVFGLTAMAWQRHPHRPFFLLALSSMLTLLVVATTGSWRSGRWTALRMRSGLDAAT